MIKHIYKRFVALGELVEASKKLLPTQDGDCPCGTCQFSRYRDQLLGESGAFGELGASFEELEARVVIGPNQVVGRIHHSADHPEPVRVVLNSIGMGLPDNMALYVAPDVSGLIEALEEAREWLTGWASAKHQLDLINTALSAHQEKQRGDV